MTGTETERIEADIRRTRDDLAGTVDALSARLARQKSRAKAALVKGAVIGGVAVVALVVVRQIRARKGR